MWKPFLRYNAVSLVTVIAGLIVIGGVRANLIDASAIPTVTLLLVCLLATSEIIDKSGKFQKLQESIDGLSARIGVEHVRRLGSSADAHQQMATAVMRARRSVALAALGRGYARGLSPQKEAFHKALETIIDRGEVSFTYVTAFYDRFRWERVKRWLGKQNISKFYVGHYAAVTVTPMLGVATLYFLIIDDSEVIVRLPKRIGEPEEYLSLQEPRLIELFKDYFTLLWTNSDKISERTYDVEKMDAIGAALAGAKAETR